MDLKEKVKPNLLAEFAKKKSSATEKSFGYFSNSPASRFPRPENHKPSAKRGGRNGQGKPC